MAPNPRTVAAASSKVTFTCEGSRSRKSSTTLSGNRIQSGAGVPMARVSCQYSTSAAPSTTATAAYTQKDPANKTARTMAISTTAVRTLTSMLDRRAAARARDSASALAASIGDLLGAGAENAHPAPVPCQRLIEVGAPKIRPERRRAVKLRVGGLPEQEVTD